MADALLATFEWEDEEKELVRCKRCSRVRRVGLQEAHQAACFENVAVDLDYETTEP